jgi:hypothetical protein
MSGQIDEISLLDLKSLRVRYDASDRHDRLRRFTIDGESVPRAKPR